MILCEPDSPDPSLSQTTVAVNQPAGNTNPPPLPLARRAPEVTGDIADVDADGDVVDSPPTDYAPPEASDQVTHYSSRSEIRHPVQLFQNIFRDAWRGRELAWRLFVRNLRGMYRQTLLGLFWVFLPPILNTAFWVFLRNSTDVLKTDELQINFTVYVLVGMIFWQSFIEAFQMPLNMLNKNRNMISKLNFPRESLLLVGIGEVLFDLAIRLLLLIPAFVYFQVTVPITILLMPLALLALVLLALGLGLLILPIGSLYQDVSRFISVALPFWMILTPIVYPVIEGSPLNWINPAAPLLVVARDWTLMGGTEFVQSGLIYGLAAVPVFLLGLLVYRISIPLLIERMTA